MNLRNAWLGPDERSANERPIRALPLLFFMVLVFPYTSAIAGTLRCGSYLIEEGDDAFSVLAKCGEPTERTTITEPLYVASADGGIYPTGLVGHSAGVALLPWADELPGDHQDRRWRRAINSLREIGAHGLSVLGPRRLDTTAQRNRRTATESGG